MSRKLPGASGKSATSQTLQEQLDLRIEKLIVRNPAVQKVLFSIQKFELAPGSKVLIDGPSGIGKTTFLHVLAGLMLPAEGKIFFGSREMTAMTDSERTRFRRQHIGLVFQRLNLLDQLTTLENVILALPGLESEEIRARNLLSELGLEKVIDRRTAALSLGEQQRAAVARVLLQNPEIILADEPTSSLDDVNATAIAKSLLGLGPAKTVIVVSHDDRLKKHFQKIVHFGELVS